MHALYEMKEKLCKELEEINKNPSMSMADLEVINKIVDALKDINEILMYEDGGQSQDGNWEARGSYDGGGNSYARRGMHYVRGHYSRNDGTDGGYSQGYSQRYSRSNGTKSMLENMLRDAKSDRERRAIERCMEEM